jgi:pyrroline-5-carboxylate reductase
MAFRILCRVPKPNKGHSTTRLNRISAYFAHMTRTIAFIGGGNMASAIIGGLRKTDASAPILVVEPYEEARAKLQRDFQIVASASADATLATAGLVVWAVKPQSFQEAAAPVKAHTPAALHLSVAAGIRSESIAGWLGTEQIIRCMPNTPALIGKGITGLYARPAVSAAQRDWAQSVIATTGSTVWLEQEEQLDAVTAISGSGPAYVFFFIEAMTAAGLEMGLSAAQAQQLAIATFIGAGELAAASDESPEVLRQRVTSKGGTTFAAISSMEASGMKASFIQALHAARTRAQELGAPTPAQPR